MTQGIIKTQGTRLFFNSIDGSPPAILKVACATGITGLGGPADQIPTECLESDEGESVPGFKRPQPVTVPFNVIPRSAAHQALHDLEDSGATVGWMVVMSDQDGSPTMIDADGYLESPGATSVGFRGYIVDINWDLATNEIVRGTLTIQRTGAKQYDWPAADLP